MSRDDFQHIPQLRRDIFDAYCPSGFRQSFVHNSVRFFRFMVFVIRRVWLKLNAFFQPLQEFDFDIFWLSLWTQVKKHFYVDSSKAWLSYVSAKNLRYIPDPRRWRIFSTEIRRLLWEKVQWITRWMGKTQIWSLANGGLMEGQWWYWLMLMIMIMI